MANPNIRLEFNSHQEELEHEIAKYMCRCLRWLRARIKEVRGCRGRQNGRSRRACNTGIVGLVARQSRAPRLFDGAENVKRRRRARRASRKKERLRSDHIYALTQRVRNAVAHSLYSRSVFKSSRTFSALGYTPNDLARHLERQFLDGMGWHNRSQWHIDHIIPLVSFKFSSMQDAEFKAAWALTNMRPIWATDNILKGAHRLTLL